MGDRRRVVITGLGVIAPTGIGKDVFWQSCKEGKSGIKPITRFNPEGYDCRIAGEINNFDPLDYMDPKKAKRSDRFAHFAIASARMAISDAQLNLDKIEKDRVGVFYGAAMGGMPYAENQHVIFMEKGIKRVSPYLAETIFPGAASCHIGLEFGFRGVNGTLSTGCSSGTDAIGHALDAIRCGRADIIIAGGTEDPLGPLTFASFVVIRALTRSNDEPEKATKPFDLNRDGFALSEGAGSLVLEELGHAIKRGAKIYAEIGGYGSSCDAYHMVQPSPDGSGMSVAIKSALRDADITTDEVDFIKAHGTSTTLNDVSETRAIKTAFGERAYHIPVSSIKSGLGHTWGASGAIEAAACTMAIQDQFLPPTINYETPDPQCDLDYVPNKGRAASVEVVITNSASFGGKNSSLLIRKYYDTY
jgi:3-oxoacyl-[acyl-carrier-protein] synthase II